VDHRRWSWLALVGLLAVAGVGARVSGSWVLALAAALGLAATLWQFFLPVRYEISAAGLRRSVLGRTRLIPWPAIHAFQLRPTGVVFYGRADAVPADVLRALFVPYPADEDEFLCGIRQHLPHAAELE
jgi:hypothetical protein